MPANSVMTMDTLTSLHVFITLTLTYLSTVWQHTESAHAWLTVTPPRLFRGCIMTMLFWLSAKVCMSQHVFPYIRRGTIDRNHSGLNHSSGLRLPG